MRRLLTVLVVATLVLGGLAVWAGVSPGPAPNSGDGTPDGSGFGDEGAEEAGPFGVAEAPGPAPNSGDGTPDGSGF